MTVADLNRAPRQYADPGEVAEFMEQAEKNYGAVVLGEPTNVEAASVLVATRYPVVMGGPGGSGKTTLLKEIVKGIKDTPADALAIVPGLSDVTPTQLIGGQSVIEDWNAEGSLTSHQVRKVPGIITPTTRFIRADEFPRLGKKAREALLPVLEERTIRNTEGEVALPNLLGFWATQNAARPLDRLEVIDASRFGAGLIFDAEDEDTREAASLDLADGVPREIETEPFVTLEEFAAIQNSVVYNRDSRDKPAILFGEDIKEQSVVYQKFIRGVVKTLTGETESLNRMSGQIGRIARGFAFKDQEERVSSEHVQEAAQLVLASRVIMLDTSGNPAQTLSQAFTELKAL